MAGFASKRTGSWNLFDWVVAIFVFVLVASLFVAAINTLAPNSSLDIALHNAGQAVSRFLLLIAAFFNFIANLFAQM